MTTLAAMKTQINDFTLEEQINFMAYLANLIQMRSNYNKVQRVDTEDQKNRKPIRHLGKWSGQIWMSDDFDETPDCFEEYM